MFKEDRNTEQDLRSNLEGANSKLFLQLTFHGPHHKQRHLCSDHESMIHVWAPNPISSCLCNCTAFLCHYLLYDLCLLLLQLLSCRIKRRSSAKTLCESLLSLSHPIKISYLFFFFFSIQINALFLFYL